MAAMMYRLAIALAALALVAAAPPTKRLSVVLPDAEGLLPERYGVSADAAKAPASAMG